MSSDKPFRLWVASDDEQVIAAFRPLKVTRNPRVREWGSIIDLRAVPRSGIGLVPAFLVIIALLAAGAFSLFRIAPFVGTIVLPLAVFALAVGYGLHTRQVSGEVLAPHLAKSPDLHRVLNTREEREDFLRLVGLAERVGETLPGLQGLIDPVASGKALAQALWDGARLLHRRREIRSLIEEIEQHNLDGLPPESLAVQKLTSQRQKAEELREQVNHDLVELAANLEAVAEAGERFLREQELNRTANRAEEVLSELLPGGLSEGVKASEQLADETTAVLSAYRELTDLYGGRAEVGRRER